MPTPLQQAVRTHTHDERPPHPARPLDALWALIGAVRVGPDAPLEPLQRGLVALLLRLVAAHFATEQRLASAAAGRRWRDLLAWSRCVPADETLSLDAIAALRVPDAAAVRVLEALLGGDERLSMRTHGVEALGDIYATLMDAELGRAETDSVAVRPRGAVVSLTALLSQPPGARVRWLRDRTGCKLSAKDGRVLAAATDPAGGVRALGRRVTRDVPAGGLYLKAGLARRRSGSHYTPRAVSGPIVAATLAPLLARSDVLSLSVCDPAMGPGAFLLEACRQLADALATRRGCSVAAARLLVASRCVYGVDTDPVAVSLARLSLWLLVGEPSLDLTHQLRCGDALIDDPKATVRPMRWSADLPQIFARPDPGFDAVIGNPPFRNAVEATTGRTAADAAYFRAAYPRFAKGAYDYCLLFWARLDSLLRRGGRYGMLSPTALLSSTKPWQPWMHANLRPDGLLLLPVDQFEVARVRTVGIIGGRGTAQRCRVENRDDLRPEASFARDWAPDITNWYEATRPEAIRLPDGMVPLSALVLLSAGCATGAAYALRPLVVDDADGVGLRLITTGAIDRYRCKWGVRPTRFLKQDHAHPRWPDGDDIPGAVRRARDRQQGAKILVGGLTAVIEAWLDDAGDSAGIVQTWVLHPQQPALRYALLGLLNSATFSRLFMQKFGGGAMSGAQTTIKKADLARSRLPALQPQDHPVSIAAVLDPAVPLESLSAPVLQAAVARVAVVLQDQQGEGRGLDRLGHILAGRLFGRTVAEAESDYRWWAARGKVEPDARALDGLRADPVLGSALCEHDASVRF